MATLQESRDIKIITPLGDDVLMFRKMTAEEKLGRLFEYRLDVVSKDANIVLDDLLGQNVTVRLKMGDNGSRFFNGFVSRFCFVGLTENFYSYQITLRPWLWFLTRTADCRIFQNQKAPDIIKTVFRDHGFSDFEEKLSATYRDWEYCVQYRETDFNFVSRLMEQEGIYYYFTHEDGKHTLVLSDSIEAHEAVPDYEEVPYFPYEQTLRRERDHIYDWFVAQEVQPGSFALNDFNFEKPKADLNVKLKQPYGHVEDQYEVYDYPGEYSKRDDGDEYVRKRVEELHAQYAQIKGQGNARGLMVGALFSLTQYPRHDQNKEYLVTSALYELQSDEYGSAGSASEEQIFICSFSAIDSAQPFRSSRITPRPVVQGPQTAIVVGPGGQEIHTDKFGRVKVQFHWDREGKNDENSSCWIRVSHSTAGKGWGSIQIPRIGQEVIVDFLEGDPDLPIITGRVYNADSMPPYDLPNSGMVSGMKSNSTPGGGGSNEISMDDTKGKENITIHAQHDMNTTVENNQSCTVVSGNRSVAVQSGTQSETVKGNASLTVQAGDRTVNVTGNYKLDTTAEINMQAPSKISLTCGGSSITIEPGQITLSAGGGATLKLDANAFMQSSQGSNVLLDGNALMVSTAGDQVLLDGKATLSSPKEAKVDAPISTLSGGGSATKADASGVAVTGVKISLNG